MKPVKETSGWLISGLAALFAPFICCIGPVLAFIFGAGAATAAMAFTEKYSGVFFGIAAISLGYAGWKLFFKNRRKIGRPIRQSVLTCPHCGHQKIAHVKCSPDQNSDKICC